MAVLNDCSLVRFVKVCFEEANSTLRFPATTTLLRDLDPSDFPLKKLADEYFWVNALICRGRSIDPHHFVYCNPDPTCTQAASFDLDEALLEHCFQSGYLFVRKVTSLDPPTDARLRQMYAGTG